MRSRVLGISLAAVLISTLSCSLSWATDWVTNIGNNVYGFYSETYPGMEYDVPNSTSNRYIHRDGGYLGVWPSTATVLLDDTTTYREGSKSLRVTIPEGGATGGLWMQFGYSSGAVTQPKLSTYMGEYSGGTLEFSIKTTTEIAMKLEWQRGTVPYSITRYLNRDAKVPLDGEWHDVSMRLLSWTGIQVSSITVPVAFSFVYPSAVDTPSTFWIDNVRWVRNPLQAGLPAIAQLRELTDDATTYVFTWSDIQMGETQWKCANQYIEYKIGYSTPSWGVRIFTDNTAADANPRYTGVISTSTSAAGLVCSTNTADVPLPMCWRISDYKFDASTMTAIRATADRKHLYCPDPANPENDPGYYPWMYIKDKSDPDFNDPAVREYTTMWDLRGIHYGEGEWGAAMSPNYIYIGADFSRIIGERGYITNKLMINLFNE